MRSGGAQARHAILRNLLGNGPRFLKLVRGNRADVDCEGEEQITAPARS